MEASVSRQPGQITRPVPGGQNAENQPLKPPGGEGVSQSAATGSALRAQAHDLRNE